MKVFISWSGDLSHKVALALRDWLPSVIQSIDPYVSSEDIDKGARWSTDISQELELSNFGILVITKDNLDAPWLNFEAGAISKSVDKSRVSPFLFGIKRAEVKGPLLQFQSTIFDKEDISKLLHSLNRACDPPCIEDTRFDKNIDVWCPSLEKELSALLKMQPEKDVSESKAGDEILTEYVRGILEEILELVRNQ
ncbi:MAG: toll/interleukin-1 receptor domain-containing protein [Anaerolineales bacterium]|nr:toll/interleukin-1 receptor domain-containing protein [Anaerolineales bacterium]